MGKSENTVTDDIKEYLDSLGKHRCWYVKFHANFFTKSGIPDIIGSLDGRFFGIEIKASYNKLSEAQEIQIELINEAGAIAFGAWSVEDVKKILY